MDKAHLLQRFFNKIFPQKDPKIDTKWKKLKDIEKKKLSNDYLKKGVDCLLDGNLKALEFFELASNLDPEDAELWLCQGKAFYKYGIYEKQEKALQVASKDFNKAIALNVKSFESWFYLGKTLMALGKFHNEIIFLNEAKEKFQEAVELSESASLQKKVELYWDLGLLWTKIAELSGEAIDLRMAIQAFHTSITSQKLAPPSSFWKDFGYAYFQMGLLINEGKMYFQAIKNFRKYIRQSPKTSDGFVLLAQTYTQLYINTVDEHYFNHANDCFNQALNKNKDNADLWLYWAQLLGESGYINNDIKKIQLSIEKCVRAYNLDIKHPHVIAQWSESLSRAGQISNRLDLLTESENKILKAIDHFPDEIEVWHAYGVCLIAYGKYFDDPDYFELAIEKLRYGISIDSSSAELWHLLGSAYFEMANNLEDVDLFKQSYEYLLKASDLKPSCPALNFDYAKALFKYSEYAANTETLFKAKIALENILQSHKSVLLQHPKWLFYYGKTLQLLGELTDNEKHLTKAIEIYLHVLLVEPDYPEIYFYIATCFARFAEISCEVETFKRSISYFLLAAKQDPENDSIWLEWGLALIHLAEMSGNSENYFNDAEQKIMKSGQLGNQGAYYQLACLCSLTERYDQAMIFLENAKNHDVLPPHEEIMEDEWLDNLRSQESFMQFLSYLEASQKTSEEL
jgi:tetratricopeptide (TPR) repeat protein